ncbi:MAG: 50S ribosomal protein L23 [Phycisphaeraceae bacterium]|nr:50S ribosomal protein L23 [Phycisphaeraceae bacterium]
MHATQIIKKPLITEKVTQDAEDFNRYGFEVVRTARKPEIKKAIEELYKVRVAKVLTQTRRGKLKRTRHGLTRTPPWKRAIVILHPDDKIQLF